MEKIRLGIIGFGCRSYGMTEIFLGFDDVDVLAVCDKYEDRVENAVNKVVEKREIPHSEQPTIRKFLKETILTLYLLRRIGSYIFQSPLTL